MAVDLVFLMGIWGGVTRLHRELMAAGEHHKAQMYGRLYAVLIASLCACWRASEVFSVRLP
jgi:hypothetical protein